MESIICRLDKIETILHELNQDQIVNLNKLMYHLYLKINKIENKKSYFEVLNEQIKHVVKIRGDYNNEISKDNNGPFVYIERELFSLEKTVRTLNQCENLKLLFTSLPTIYLLLNLMGINVFTAGWIVNLFTFLTINLQISDAKLIIFYSLSGSLLYYLSKYISKTIVKFIFATYATVILISLLFINSNPQGQILSISITPELISFIFGYSTETIFIALRKLMDKMNTSLE